MKILYNVFILHILHQYFYKNVVAGLEICVNTNLAAQSVRACVHMCMRTCVRVNVCVNRQRSLRINDEEMIACEVCPLKIAEWLSTLLSSRFPSLSLFLAYFLFLYICTFEWLFAGVCSSTIFACMFFSHLDV